jgi:hypothetical protein
MKHKSPTSQNLPGAKVNAFWRFLCGIEKNELCNGGYKMTERKNNVVGILQFRDILTCIQALEKLEKEAQTIVEQTPDSELNEEWEKWQGLLVDVRSALGAFRLLVDRGPIRLPNTAYTIHWEESLEQAMNAMGLAFKSEVQEKERHSEWDE